MANDAANATEADDGGLENFKSILDVACTLGVLRRWLGWHYRSKREGLTAFANHQAYNGGW